ncbi:hypothetical protein [Modicisalibacter sp. MOD 31.J]|uniref:hypothetical protein n=1 Tax=Modicisalibacter sp. MOD 31.J TaxID=2831897 RepID=UPI001CC8F7F8|nr:hypothetical protein [Modicisalibacter sp. MOD 31.J]MBZ9576763.1 hypothetical protein [Modicisalibacter sp. MOD 31.J]
MSDIIREGGKRMRHSFARIREEAEKLIAENERLRNERDALAAHVERIERLCNGYGTPLSKTVPALGKILDDTPETSLAHREKEMKALGLEWSLMLSRSGAREMITRLRREAKDGAE